MFSVFTLRSVLQPVVLGPLLVRSTEKSLPRQSDLSVKMTTHLHPLSLRMSGALPPLLLYVFMSSHHYD